MRVSVLVNIVNDDSNSSQTEVCESFRRSFSYVKIFIRFDVSIIDP